MLEAGVKLPLAVLIYNLDETYGGGLLYNTKYLAIPFSFFNSNS